MAIMHSLSKGTGEKLTAATIVVAGVAALIASLLSTGSVWLQTKNYRKPLLQRYVVRILLMVPIYAISSWTSIMSQAAALALDPIRDIYEAFTIYTFFQLLINFLGGERALIIMMHGREPVAHLWPLNYVLPRVDISDPHTFLAIKRGILQYAWLKPLLGLITIVMKTTGVFAEGNLSDDSGYLWTGIIYNVSVTLSLYSLGMFWIIMSKDLQPFRPVPKFLCIKLVIFASYWQGFFLSILVWLGAIPDDVEDYTADNLAAAIQDALICIEMPIFAVAHWYAFSWHDYADVTISAARMPVKFALRDAFGVKDLIEDTKDTFRGDQYEYRLFDSGDNVIAHEESSSRVKRMMEGMRYERNGKGKYWIPKPGEATSRTPLLSAGDGGDRSRSRSPMRRGGEQESTNDTNVPELDADDEKLFDRARKLEFGDWNYPVITANQASKERWRYADPDLITTSANRHLLQPTEENATHRAKNVRETVEQVTKKKHKHKKSPAKGKASATAESNAEPSANGEEGRAPGLRGMLRHHSSASSSVKSDRSQLVDLVIEDTVAEETERVRARKEGSSGWNTTQPKRFVKTYGRQAGEEIREGYEPNDEAAIVDPKEHEDTESQRKGKMPEVNSNDRDSVEADQWKALKDPVFKLAPKYGQLDEDLEDNVWRAPQSPARENP